MNQRLMKLCENRKTYPSPRPSPLNGEGSGGTEAAIAGIRFTLDKLVLVLGDEREIALPLKKIKWLRWLAEATPKQRADWTLEPLGYAVWWNALDDGVELAHALSVQRLPHRAIKESLVSVHTA